MNWFERHLNWTWVLGQFVPSMVVFFVAFFFAFLVAFLGWNVPVSVIRAVGIILYIFDIIFIILLTLWVLARKARSLWWVLIIFVPLIGFIIFLLLANHSIPEDQGPIKPPKIPPGKVTTIDF